MAERPEAVSPPAKRRRTDDATVASPWAAALYDKIRARIDVVAEKLGRKPADVLEAFPHLASPTAYSAWVQTLPASVTPPSVARYIDHTVLKQHTTRADIEKLCEQAIHHRFFSVCVNASWVAYCAELLKKDTAKDAPLVCSVVNFPLGAGGAAVKAFETATAIKDGAREIDMVFSIGRFLAGEYADVLADIEAVVAEGKAASVPVKVIIEICLLENDDNIIDASILTVLAGAAFVKTSTGFSTSGATLDACRLMKAVAGAQASVKAAGGVRDYATALDFIRSGTERIGTSSGHVLAAGEAAAKGAKGADDGPTAEAGGY